MNLLILGGTRFFGKLFLSRCLEEGHRVTYVSRRHLPRKENLKCIQGERDQVISRLDGSNFDVVIDFSGYDGATVRAALRQVATSHYIFVSTLWASQLINKSRSFCAEELYVRKKIEAEVAVENWARDQGNATILRFPIILGPNDHSGRLDYLARRISQNSPITVDESERTELAITFVEDAVNLLMKVTSLTTHNSFFQIYSCSTGAIVYENFLNLIGKALNVRTKIIFGNPDELKRYFPKFYQVDPFWREKPFQNNDQNAFLDFSVPITSYEKWLQASLKTYDLEVSNLSNPDRQYGWMQAYFLEEEKKWIDVNCR